MLALVTGFCPICNDGKEKSLISGVCQYHYWGQLRTRSAPPVRSRAPVRKAWDGVSSSDPLLDAWYERKISEISGYCMECHEIIATWNYKYAKAAVAHILPKEYFPSVQTHDLNCMWLGGGCGCHHRWDSSWENASTMKVVPFAIERFRIFYPEIALAERKRIPLFFLNAL